jgi:Acetyltransferase (GNAT) family
VRLLEVDDRPVGYLHADTTMPGRIYVSGVAIHPDVQRRGLGTLLIRKCLDSLESRVRMTMPIVTVTSPRNIAMLKVLYETNFGARWVLRNFFGVGCDRFGLQLRLPNARDGDPAPWWLRVDALEQVYRAVEVSGAVVRGLADREGCAHFELVPGRDRTFPVGGKPPR